MPSNGGAGVGSRAFRNLLRQVEQFTPHQIEDLISCANSIRRTREAHAEIEARTEQEHNCPFCGAEKRRKWGYTRTGNQRFQCGDCKKTFSGLTGTAVCGLHRHDLFLEAIRDMLSDNPSSCCKLGRTLDVTKDTIWRWRMMILRAMESIAMTEFSGIVEADECYQRESRKGSREWVQHAQNPTKLPAPPRLQWHRYKSGRIKMLRGLSRWQLPILTLADRSGARGMQRIANRRDATIY